MTLLDSLALRPDFNLRGLVSPEFDAALDSIAKSYGDRQSAIANVAAVLRKVEAAWRKKDWAGVTIGDISACIQAIYRGDHAVSAGLRQFLDAELAVTTRQELAGALVPVYFELWSEGSDRTMRLRDLIIAKATHLPVRWKSLFQACPEFLATNGATRAVGTRMVEAARPYDWLKTIGLPDPHGPGFMVEAHRAFLDQCPGPRSGNQLTKLLEWAAPQGAARLDDRRTAAVLDHILSPWVAETCPAAYRDDCARRLVDLFGDPRRDRSALWSLVREDRLRVLIRWLARQSMETIFEVVTESEKTSGFSQQWADRRRFWTQIYDLGLIDEACIVLGGSAVEIAKRMAKERSDPVFLNFARQVGNKRDDTCLLIMRIGEKVVVEGSHNFRVHFFPNPTQKMPELYQDSYDLDDILLPRWHRDAQAHLGDWQTPVQRRLRR